MKKEVEPKDTTRAAAYSLWIQTRKEMKMNKMISKSKWFALAALLMFAGATFQITNDHYMLGVICFAAAVSFSCSANVYRKKEREEMQKEVDK